MKKVLFETHHLYYWANFWPIVEELKKRRNYDIQVSMIGYKVILKTGTVVNADEVTTIDFTMEETVLSFGEDVVVMGKKPLFDVDETSSIARVRKEEIEAKVVSSVEDILSEQIGVTTQDNEIHIRGGRIDESMFVVDGFSVKDPLSGYSGNLFVNADAIEELEKAMMDKTSEGYSKYLEIRKKNLHKMNPIPVCKFNE